MHKFIFRFRLKKSAILFNCPNFVVLFIPRFIYQKIDFLLFLFSLININIIEAMIIIEAAKNNQVFLDSILQLQYYIGTVSGRGDKGVIEDYIKNQGRESGYQTT